MHNGLFASKLAENAVILRYNFSLSDCLPNFPGGSSHFSLLSGPSLEPASGSEMNQFKFSSKVMTSLVGV